LNTMKFAGKTAIITGSTSALGSEISRAFAARGANLALVYISEEKFTRLESQLDEFVAKVLKLKADVTDESQVTTMFQKAKGEFGSIDFLINTVGGFAGGKSVADMEESTWDKMMSLNLKSAFLCSKAAMEEMRTQGHGKIINISAMTALQSKPNRAAYAVAKAGVIKLTEAVALEGKEFNIQANAIAPSVILTEANKADMPNADFSKWVTPNQIAETIVFLCSPAGDAITGTVLKLQGRV